jgi:hypothetical protein
MLHFVKYKFRIVQTLHNLLLLRTFRAGGKIETNEMSWACGAYGGGQRCAQGVGGEV